MAKSETKKAAPKGKPAKVKMAKVKVVKVKVARRKKVLAPPPVALGPSSAVLDRLWSVVVSRRDADPSVSHSARLLARGTTKVAQKFGEEAVECVIEAATGNRAALIGESADVLYHLIVVWVNAGVRPDEVWAELKRREGVSGIAEKAARKAPLARKAGTKKIP